MNHSKLIALLAGGLIGSTGGAVYWSHEAAEARAANARLVELVEDYQTRMEGRISRLEEIRERCAKELGL